MKCDFFDGSAVNGSRQPILHSFILDKPPGYKIFCEPETIQYKKIIKSVLNTITSYLEVDEYEELIFNGETLTFTMHLEKTHFYFFLKSSQKLETASYCVRVRHRSARTNLYGDITCKGSKVFFGFCSISTRKKSMTVSDITIVAEGLGDFFKNLGKNEINVSKKTAQNVLRNAGGNLDITANNVIAAASRSPKIVVSTLQEVINFYHTGKELYLGKWF